MATPKKPAIPSSIIRLESTTEHSYQAQYRWSLYRFMFDSGDVVDVQAIRDDSDLRRALLDITKQDGIVGVAVIETYDESDEVPT